MASFFLFFSCIWSALLQFLCSVSNSSVCATFFKFFTCSCLQSYICRDFVLWEKHENKHNFPLLSWLGGFLQDAVWTKHSLRSFSKLSSYFHHDHHHQLDKPARLTIRVLWFLFLIAFVKSEVRKQIGRRWHCLPPTSTSKPADQIMIAVGVAQYFFFFFCQMVELYTAFGIG